MFKRQLSCIILILAVMTIPAWSQSAVEQELHREIGKIIRYDTDIDFKNTPGFIVGLIDGDSTYTLSFGSKSKQSDQNIAAGDRFELGGLTKVLTSTLLAILDERKLLSLETKFNTLIPPDSRNPVFDRMSLRSLLTHTSGLPKYPPMFGDKQPAVQNPYGNFSTSDLLSSYRELSRPASDGFIYSHMNYALLETVIEEGLGITYEQVLRQYLLDPLEMHATSTSLHPPLSTGYHLSGRISSPWTFGSFTASEGLRSNVNDMIRFLRFSLRGAPDQIWNEAPGTRVNKQLSLGLGWYRVKQRRIPVIHAHSGHTDGHYAFAAIAHETQTAVIILANSAAGVEDLGFLILRLINHNWKRKHINGKKVQDP